MWRLRHQRHEIISDSIGGMAGYDAFVEVVAEDRADAQAFNCVQIDHDLRCSFERILGRHRRRRGFLIDERVVKKLHMSMAVERTNVVGGT